LIFGLIAEAKNLMLIQ